MNSIPSIKPKQETEKIISFLKKTFIDQHIENAVIGLSGGIDSAVSFLLLCKAMPKEHVFPIHLSYYAPIPAVTSLAQQVKIPKENFLTLSIKNTVDAFKKSLIAKDSHSGKPKAHPESDSGQAVRRPELTAEWARMTQVRLGNIMARTRMMYLFDFAKKKNAMVVGTENKSEHYLGYFTRFGDAASDIEPIQHLYKTQIFELATYLDVPKEIITARPTANLWAEQTDEGEFGFTYQEADQVLYYYFEQKLSVDEIVKKGLSNAEKIIQRVKENEYKHKAPYTL